MRQMSVVSCQLSAGKRFLFLACAFLAISYSPSGYSFAEEIKSKSALVMEASTGRVLFAKNPQLKLPPASTTKLVTAMVVLDNVRLNETVVISEKAAEVPSLRGTRLKANETMTVETLLYAALLRSSNDAAFALAEKVSGSEGKFVELMNRKVVAIGASETRFINTTGLPGKGQRTTVYDLAKILRHALKYPVIREIIHTKEREICTEEGRTINLENTNRLLWSDSGVLGGKTGYTRAARHCFVYAGEKNGETIIVSLLGAPSRQLLWDEAELLTEKGVRIIAANEQPLIYFTKVDYEKNPRQKFRKPKGKNNRAKFAKASLNKKSKKIHNVKKENGNCRKETRKKKGVIVA